MDASLFRDVRNFDVLAASQQRASIRCTSTIYPNSVVVVARTPHIDLLAIERRKVTVTYKEQIKYLGVVLSRKMVVFGTITNLMLRQSRLVKQQKSWRGFCQMCVDINNRQVSTWRMS